MEMLNYTYMHMYIVCATMDMPLYFQAFKTVVNDTTIFKLELPQKGKQ